MMRNAGLTPKQKAELAALASMPDSEIDTSDIPSVKRVPALLVVASSLVLPTELPRRE